MSQEIRDANRYGPLTEERLQQLEAKLKSRLPDDYRSFLLEHNGGRPTLSRFKFTLDDEDQDSVLEWFFAVHDQPYKEPRRWNPKSGELPPHFARSLEAVWGDFRSEVPRSGLLPIGRDPGGNLIGLGISGKRAGAIWLYDHETESFVKLAENFTSFLASLTPLPPGNWAPWLIVG